MNEIKVKPLKDTAFIKDFLDDETALSYLNVILEEVKWQQFPIKMFGKTFMQPRLIAWQGDPGISYTYSNTSLVANGWNNKILELKHKIETFCNHNFNSVLINCYRNGLDSMGWHSDDESSLGEEPYIASLSLGAEREIQFRNKKDLKKRADLILSNGSLLLMFGKTQSEWQHQIPKRKKIDAVRVNLTFRKIKGC